MNLKDLVLTEKMKDEVSKIGQCPSETSWDLNGTTQTEKCMRCEQCGGFLDFGHEQAEEGRVAQHLVMEHGYTWDGLTATELEDMCHD